MLYLNHVENKSHSDGEFPIDYYHLDSQHPEYRMKLHWHLEYELIRVLNGKLTLYADGTPFLMEAGDICFLHDGVLHEAVPESCEYECIDFDITFLQRALPDELVTELIRKKQLVNTRLPADSPEISKQMDALSAALNSYTDGSVYLAVGALFSLFGLIRRNSLFHPAPEKNDNLRRGFRQIKKVLRFIEEHYTEKLTLEQMSREVGMSPKYFCRFFKSITHRTPIDYLNDYRIEAACALLRQDENSLTTVAYNCGFNDYSYFIKQFRKYKGITPHKYLHSLSPLE